MWDFDYSLEGINTSAVKGIEDVEGFMIKENKLFNSVNCGVAQLRAHSKIFLDLQRELQDSMKELQLLIGIRKLKNQIITLNAGGEMISCSRTAFDKSHKTSLFAFTYSGIWDHILPKDKNGRVFLDIDKLWLNPIISCFRDFPSDKESISLNISHIDSMKLVSSYFNMELQYNQMANSNIVPLRNSYGMLQENFSRKVTGARLLYRKSIDDNDREYIARKCNGLFNTLVVIKDDQGNVFGGFHWGQFSESLYAHFKNYFLFVLPENDEQGKWLIIPTDEEYIGRKTEDYYSTYSILKFDNHLIIETRPVSRIDDLRVWTGCTNLPTPYPGPDPRAPADPHLPPIPRSCEYIKRRFIVEELEIYEIMFEKNKNPFNHHNLVPSTAPTPDPVSEPVVAPSFIAETHLQRESIDDLQLVDPKTGVLDENSVTAHLNQITNLHNTCQRYFLELSSFYSKLYEDSCLFRDQLRFVGKHMSLDSRLETIPPSSPSDGPVGNFTEISALIRMFVEYSKEHVCLIQSLRQQDDKSSENSWKFVSNPAMKPHLRVMNVNASGTIVTVTAHTLLQAPPGSYLYNLVSDDWGHDVDEDGNLYQEVDPVLFQKVVSYLRMKAMAQAKPIPGDCSTKREIIITPLLRGSLEKLLDFYQLSDVTLVDDLCQLGIDRKRSDPVESDETSPISSKKRTRYSLFNAFI